MPVLRVLGSVITYSDFLGTAFSPGGSSRAIIDPDGILVASHSRE